MSEQVMKVLKEITQSGMDVIFLGQSEQFQGGMRLNGRIQKKLEDGRIAHKSFAMSYREGFDATPLEEAAKKVTIAIAEVGGNPKPQES